MQAFMVLADAAQHDAASGKINILGGDWSIITQRLRQTALVVFYRVAWQEIEQEKRFSLRLLGEDDKPVHVGDPEQPVEYVGRFAFSDSEDAHDDYIRMVDIHNSIAITVPPLPLVLGRRYTWSLEVDGEPMSSVAFVVRPDDEGALDTAD